MRADMFTVCSVFYELSPSFSAPPRPPLQWCNGGGRWEPEKWDDVLLLTNSLTNVVLLPFSCTPPHSDFTSAKVHWDTLLQHLPVSRLPAASQTSVLSSLFRLNRCLCPPSSAVINYFTYFQGSKQMPTCTELRKKKNWLIRRQDSSPTWSRGFLIDILCCSRSSVVTIICLHLYYAAQEYHKNKMT